MTVCLSVAHARLYQMSLYVNYTRQPLYTKSFIKYGADQVGFPSVYLS